MQPNHPAHPTPPPYHQPPPPNTINNEGSNIRNESDEFTINNAELNKRLASAKSDLKRLATENGSIVSEYSKKIQDQLNEIRSLKELNARLSEDNQELRDLCCFLDDDRQKGRKLAREWQRFGRYTASVMRQEVSNYQSKLKDLAGKQDDLIRDNLELKELCLYLDEERAGGVSVCTECGGPHTPTHPPLQAVRDEGDGSSSSTNNDESEISGSNLVEELNAVNARENLYLKGNKMGLNDEVLLYIRNLEDRVGQLEAGSEYPLSTQFNHPFRTKIVKDLSLDHINDNLEKDMGSRPESVTNAMKVLEVHEQILEKSLDSDEASDELGDGEKALVREMCNVVWRKLEEG
jgi:FtsZ-binding cell division protein ZapB